MKLKLKRQIKKNVNNTDIYRIVNLKNGKFKECGSCIDCSSHGKSWYKLSDVRKAYNMIPEQERKNFKIVCLRVKLKEVVEEWAMKI